LNNVAVIKSSVFL